jgi:nucleoid-associated protein YgaU
MGVFDFIKEAGQAAKAGQIESFKAEQMLKSKLEEYNLDVADPGISFANGEVTLTGEAADQATREKVVLAVGNTPGVHRVHDKMTVRRPLAAAAEAEPVEVAPRFYTVVRGDTLSKIAKAHYGDANKYPVIFEANKPMLKDPNLIYPGQVLRIPDLEA